MTTMRRPALATVLIFTVGFGVGLVVAYQVAALRRTFSPLSPSHINGLDDDVRQIGVEMLPVHFNDDKFHAGTGTLRPQIE